MHIAETPLKLVAILLQNEIVIKIYLNISNYTIHVTVELDSMTNDLS